MNDDRPGDETSPGTAQTDAGNLTNLGAPTDTDAPGVSATPQGGTPGRNRVHHADDEQDDDARSAQEQAVDKGEVRHVEGGAPGEPAGPAPDEEDRS